jgi:peptidoglycan/xylan/chitin deacetylase (PgdA/CDA1 family)
VTPVPILLYHSVGSTRAATYARWCIAPGRFVEHLDALVDAGYTFLTVSQLVDATAAGELPERPMVITFDDGRADVADHALAPMAERGIRSTIYVVSGRVGGTSDWLAIADECDQPMMGWSQIAEAVAAGVEIGAHSVNHVELDTVPRSAAAEEIHRSREQLADGLGDAVRSFAYPHGYYSAGIRQLVHDAGFDSACAVHDRWSSDRDDRFALARLIVDAGTTADELTERLRTPSLRRRHGRTALRVGWRTARRVRRAVSSATR